MLKNPLSEKIHRYKKKVAAYTIDMERMEQEKKEEWATIKDFGVVDAVRADAGAKRIAKLTLEIAKMKREQRKLQKFINEHYGTQD